MNKYESLEYLKSLNLPICTYKKFNWYEYNEAIQFANSLREHNLGVGLRTDTITDSSMKYSYPFIKEITNDEIRELLLLYKDKYYYLLSESPDSNTVITQGVVYLMPNRVAIIYANDADIYTCRKAIESPSKLENIKRYIRDWASALDVYTTLRNILVEASKIDNNIFSKRIEWSLFKERGYIFWQISDDISEYL